MSNRVISGEVKQISLWIKQGLESKVMEKISDWPVEQLTSLLIALPLRRATVLHGWLPAQAAVKVLLQINPGLRALLLQDARLDRIATIAKDLDDDDIVDLLIDLPSSVATEVLDLLPVTEVIRHRLSYGEDSAAAIMTNKFVAVLDDWDVGTATRMIRRKAADIEVLHEIYVVDSNRCLVGRLKVRDLLLHKKDTPIKDILRSVRVTVQPHADQEEVLGLAEQNKVHSIPVLDSEQRVMGRITLDELREIAQDEADEDIKLMSGVTPSQQPDSSLKHIIGGRLPWLIGGLMGASLAALVVGSFEQELEKAAILASFIPIVMAMAGNAGIQSSTVTVQGMAAGTLWLGNAWARIGKELIGASINGCIVAVLLSALIVLAAQVTAIHEPGRLALAAGLSLAAVTVLAATLGAAIPLVLKRVGVDPAVATGVFITTSNDIFGVLIFFMLATSLYLTDAVLL